MDARLVPATPRVALAGSGATRNVMTDGTPMRVAAPCADLDREPDGRRDRQLIFGADVTVIERRHNRAFVQAAADGYCGWVDLAALGTPAAAVTHRVRAPATHVYPKDTMKEREEHSLSLNSRVSVAGVEGAFARLATGGWIPVQHLAADPADDPAAVALSLLGTPYLWGGNSRGGVDCSGLVQIALHACAIRCPGDSDQQEKAFPVADDRRRGDLLFWPGHVAMVIDASTMVHATAWTMSVITENIDAAIARIDAAGDGPFLGVRRPGPGDRIAFP